MSYNVGKMVVISKKSRGAARGQAGWVSGVSEDGTQTTVLLRNGGEIQVQTHLLLDASKGFVWPKGAQAEMSVYDEDNPQRIPAEGYFSGNVQRDINDVRSGSQYVNLWLLIDSLKNLSDPNVSAGFHTWLWAIEAILGRETCKRIGETVCDLMGFTIEEGEELFNGPYRISEAKRYGLEETATWDEVHRARNEAHEREMHSH